MLCNYSIPFLEGLTVPTGKCCHRDYAPYCCSDIPVCDDGGNATVEKVVFESDPCLTPWNLSACMLGYYSTNGLDILPCPAGEYVSKSGYKQMQHQRERGGDMVKDFYLLFEFPISTSYT